MKHCVALVKVVPPAPNVPLCSALISFAPGWPPASATESFRHISSQFAKVSYSVTLSIWWLILQNRPGPLQRWARHSLAGHPDICRNMLQSWTLKLDLLLLRLPRETPVSLWLQDRIHSFALHLGLFCLIEEYAARLNFHDHAQNSGFEDVCFFLYICTYILEKNVADL